MVIMVLMVDVIVGMDLRDTQFFKSYLIMEIILKIDISN